MHKILFVIISCLLQLNVFAQIDVSKDTLNQEGSPKGGVNALAIKYYGIEFSKEQRSFLKNKQIELIYQIDVEGKPTLAEVNGVEGDLAIIDSLQQKTLEIDNFNPTIVEGVAIESVYFLKMQFPTYQLPMDNFGRLYWNRAVRYKMDDFEYMTLSDMRMEVLLGGTVNQLLGEPASYFHTGGGINVKVLFTDKRKYIYGLATNFYGMKRKTDLPLKTTREQFESPAFANIGLAFGKWFNKISVHGELHYSIINLTERIGDADPDWIQLKGFSPKAVFHYPIKLGKGSPLIYSSGAVSMYEYAIDLSIATSYQFLSIKEASGPMIEIGVSFRFGPRAIDDYQLK